MIFVNFNNLYLGERIQFDHPIGKISVEATFWCNDGNHSLVVFTSEQLAKLCDSAYRSFTIPEQYYKRYNIDRKFSRGYWIISDDQEAQLLPKIAENITEVSPPMAEELKKEELKEPKSMLDTTSEEWVRFDSLAQGSKVQIELTKDNRPLASWRIDGAGIFEKLSVEATIIINKDIDTTLLAFEDELGAPRGSSTIKDGYWEFFGLPKKDIDYFKNYANEHPNARFLWVFSDKTCKKVSDPTPVVKDDFVPVSTLPLGSKAQIGLWNCSVSFNYSPNLTANDNNLSSPAIIVSAPKKTYYNDSILVAWKQEVAPPGNSPFNRLSPIINTLRGEEFIDIVDKGYNVAWIKKDLIVKSTPIEIEPKKEEKPEDQFTFQLFESIAQGSSVWVMAENLADGRKKIYSYKSSDAHKEKIKATVVITNDNGWTMLGFPDKMHVRNTTSIQKPGDYISNLTGKNKDAFDAFSAAHPNGTYMWANNKTNGGFLIPTAAIEDEKKEELMQANLLAPLRDVPIGSQVVVGIDKNAYPAAHIDISNKRSLPGTVLSRNDKYTLLYWKKEEEAPSCWDMTRHKDICFGYYALNKDVQFPSNMEDYKCWWVSNNIMAEIKAPPKQEEPKKLVRLADVPAGSKIRFLTNGSETTAIIVPSFGRNKTSYLAVFHKKDAPSYTWSCFTTEERSAVLAAGWTTDFLETKGYFFGADKMVEIVEEAFSPSKEIKAEEAKPEAAKPASKQVAAKDLALGTKVIYVDDQGKKSIATIVYKATYTTLLAWSKEEAPKGWVFRSLLPQEKEGLSKNWKLADEATKGFYVLSSQLFEVFQEVDKEPKEVKEVPIYAQNLPIGTQVIFTILDGVVVSKDCNKKGAPSIEGFIAREAYLLDNRTLIIFPKDTAPINAWEINDWYLTASDRKELEKKFGLLNQFKGYWILGDKFQVDLSDKPPLSFKDEEGIKQEESKKIEKEETPIQTKEEPKSMKVEKAKKVNPKVITKKPMILANAKVGDIIKIPIASCTCCIDYNPVENWDMDPSKTNEVVLLEIIKLDGGGRQYKLGSKGYKGAVVYRLDKEIPGFEEYTHFKTYDDYHFPIVMVKQAKAKQADNIFPFLLGCIGVAGAMAAIAPKNTTSSNNNTSSKETNQ